MADIETYFLVIVFILIAILISATQFGKTKLYMVAKPLTMLIIIALPLLEVKVEYSVYAYLIITGLVFSLLGDLFSLYPDRYFNSSLYAYMIAHILYILAFIQSVNAYCFGIASVVIIFALIVIKFLLPKLGAMKFLIILYVVIISVTLFTGVNVDRQLGALTSISIGTVLFTVSNTLLLFNKYYKTISFADPIILSTYFVAQLLFAISI